MLQTVVNGCFSFRNVKFYKIIKIFCFFLWRLRNMSYICTIIIKQIEIMTTSNVTSETLEILSQYKETTLVEIKNAICGSKQHRSSTWTNVYAFSPLMRLADEKKSFVASIIEDAFNGRTISEKQAWCVAFFAKNNGLINA